MIDQRIREIEREKHGLQTHEKILIVEIKKSVKQGHMVLLRSWLKTLSGQDTRLRNSTTLSPNCRACSLEFRYKCLSIGMLMSSVHAGELNYCHFKVWTLKIVDPVELSIISLVCKESDMIPQFSVSETPDISEDSMAIDGVLFILGSALQGMYADAVSQLEQLLSVVGSVMHNEDVDQHTEKDLLSLKRIGEDSDGCHANVGSNCLEQLREDLCVNLGEQKGVGSEVGCRRNACIARASTVENQNAIDACSVGMHPVLAKVRVRMLKFSFFVNCT
uniref:Vacuolar protein sorting-associated protein 2 homolog 1 n=1 Tax=Tanacetum cinerariifolium TaxID=118510 RepID=A0A6L2LJZ2_TANCI|nr:vacuolar protein sorting-associated protein 2 homolog 1 [Tanacetum cinerariifolium]